MDMKRMKTKLLLSLLVLCLVLPLSIAFSQRNIQPIIEFPEENSIYNIHIQDRVLFWQTSHPSISSAEVYYFAQPGFNRVFCSYQHSQILDAGDDDIYFQISATSCFTHDLLQTEWLWLEG
jgi:hypothetical protein